MSKKSDPVYRVQFISNGERYDVFVRHISQAGMFGFIEIGEFIWDQQSSLVVDPSHEKLKDEFSDVARTFVPMHNVLRIDEVKKQGCAKITALSDKVTAFPGPLYTPKG